MNETSVCGRYSTLTNQVAITALFRVMNRYVGNLPPMPDVFPLLSCASPKHRRRE